MQVKLAPASLLHGQRDLQMIGRHDLRKAVGPLDSSGRAIIGFFNAQLRQLSARA
jgi:hypothetical protein